MKKNFTKGMYVSATKDNKNIVTNTIVAVRTTKVGAMQFKVDGDWYFENELTHAKPKFMTPTASEMMEIKKAYPILKKDHIKVLWECGHDTPNGFVGSFGFVYEKGDQKGSLVYTKGEFAPMKKADAMKYGF